MTAQPTRRTFVRATAWTVPAVTVAAAAPAFAASTPPAAPNLSTSTLGAPTRSATKITYSAPLLANTGTVDAQGVVTTWTFSAPLTSFKYTVSFTGPAEHDPATYVTLATNGPDPASPVGATQVTATMPPSTFGMTVPAGGTKNFTASHVFYFADSNPVDVTLAIVAINGGVGTTHNFSA